jgi:hypothetical protein
MAPSEWDAWEADDPPSDFADRVVARAAREGAELAALSRPSRAPGRGRRVALVVGVGLALAAATIVAVRSHSAADAHGDAQATDARREVAIGDRAVAVLERGAHLSYSGADVTQDAGDVFFRVERGARPFIVHTPAGDVTVKGTCFRVKVTTVAGAAAFVTLAVYEGRVAFSRGPSAVDVGAGETAEADGAGVRRADDRAAAAPAPSPTNPRVDRAQADRMREALRALLAEGGPTWAASRDEPRAAPGASAYPTMPPPGPPGVKDTPLARYLQQRMREDFFPLARSCYEAALAKNPKLAGKIVLHYRIVGSSKIGGVVDEANVVDGTSIDDAEFRTCVTESMMSVTFDAPPNDGEVTVTYPIEFSPDDPDAGGD